MKPNNMTTLYLRKSTRRSPWRRGFRLIPLALVCLAFSPQARGVCQEGCDLINGNTFLGDDALLNNTDGYRNTAVGFNALYSNTTGIENTAIGAAALYSNTTGSYNTASGPGALTSVWLATRVPVRSSPGSSQILQCRLWVLIFHAQRSCRSSMRIISVTETMPYE